MRLQQTAQLQWVDQQAQLLPAQGCAACATPCALGSQMAAKMQSMLPAQQLNLNANPRGGFSGRVQPVAVTVALEARALNNYAALVFGLPLVCLFLMAAFFGSTQISTPAQVSVILLVVASLLLIVTALCRSVARRFESQLRLEIRHQNPHKSE